LSSIKPLIQWSDFEQIDFRVGTIIKAEINKSAIQPALLLHIDFGPLGIKKSSAQLTDYYTTSNILNKQIIAVVNFEKKQIGKVMSECLVLGCIGGEGVSLITSDKLMENGKSIA